MLNKRKKPNKWTFAPGRSSCQLVRRHIKANKFIENNKFRNFIFQRRLTMNQNKYLNVVINNKYVKIVSIDTISKEQENEFRSL